VRACVRARILHIVTPEPLLMSTLFVSFCYLGQSLSKFSLLLLYTLDVGTELQLVVFERYV